MLRTPEQKDRLLRLAKALRSGDYEQTCGALRGYSPFADKWKYCCLGVACDISNEGAWESEQSNIYSVFGSDSAYTFTPTMRDWYGVSINEVQQLIALNDTGHPFRMIADVVELLAISEPVYA